MADGAPYHQGNLREALLGHARARLEQAGHEALSLRELATLEGVASSAPYRHFKSREALLAVLVAEGSDELEASYRAAAASEGSAKQRLATACAAYLAFAERRPELFRLMFFARVDWNAIFEEHGMDRNMGAFPVFEALIASSRPGATRLEINAMALSVWAAIHGIATLRMNGRFQRRYASGQTDEAVIEAALKTVG